MDIQSTANAFLSLCGVVSIVGGAGAIVWKCILPALKMQKRVENLEEKSKNDYEDIKEMKKMLSAICRALVDVMDHEIYGNHTDKMEQSKKKLLDFLTEN